MGKVSYTFMGWGGKVWILLIVVAIGAALGFIRHGRNNIQEGLDTDQEGCTLPSGLGYAIAPSDHEGCEAGATLQSGASCNVVCAPGHKPRTGSGKYSCARGSLVHASLQCEPITCALPDQLDTGVGGTGEDPCIPGSVLNAGGACTLGCKSGYQSKGGMARYDCDATGHLKNGTLRCQRSTCMLPGTFDEGVTGGGEVPCEAGGTLMGGEHCTLTCGTGYRNAGGNAAYRCGDSGVLDKSSLVCARTTCDVPTDLRTGRVPGGDNPCPPGGKIKSGEGCGVKCAPGYRAISGDDNYMCDHRGQLAPATLQCEQVACNLPEDFGDGILGTGAQPCKAGGKLLGGETCTVKCNSGYDMVGEEMNYAHGGIPRTFECSKAGFLKNPGVQCQKVEIRPYNSVWSIDLGGTSPSE